MKHIFFLILTTLALFGCGTNDKSDNTALLCYVRYDEALSTAKAEATLQNIDTKTAEEIPGGIRYQGTEMKLTPIIGMTYNYEYAAKFLTDHVFEWRDAEKNKKTFTLKIDPIKSFSLAGEMVSLSHSNVLSWEGSGLGKGETLVFMWENQEAGLTVPMEVSTTNNQPKIELPATKLKELSPGNWTLYLVRKKLVKDKVDGLAVNGISEFYTKPIKISLTD